MVEQDSCWPCVLYKAAWVRGKGVGGGMQG